jgi:hypothetical protein
VGATASWQQVVVQGTQAMVVGKLGSQVDIGVYQRFLLAESVRFC